MHSFALREMNNVSLSIVFNMYKNYLLMVHILNINFVALFTILARVYFSTFAVISATDLELSQFSYPNCRN